MSESDLDSTSWPVVHRPQVFEDLVGNDAIASAFKGMLAKKKVPSTFLISGIYGAGKTTTARMIARYVNCETLSACGECPSCKIPLDQHPDFTEINAAADRGIEEIRNITRLSKFKPRYNKRIFLLDECFPPDAEIEYDYGKFVSIQELVENPTVYPTVLSYNSDTGLLESQQVEKGWVVEEEKPMVRVRLENGSYQDCSFNHKWWSVNKSQMVQAQDLLSGEELLGIDGHNTRVANVSKLDDQSSLYDITVANNHNFFIRPVGSDTSVLVSNCHALTGQAASAALKGLEEPPKHTIFILATSEPNRLLDTVRSRCTHFEIKAATELEIAKRLFAICKKEKVKLEKSVLKKIATACNGHLRDAVQLLEKCAGLPEGTSEEEYESQIGSSPTKVDADLDDKAKGLLMGLYAQSPLAITRRLADVEDGEWMGLIIKMLYFNQYLIDLHYKGYNKNIWHTNSNKGLVAAVSKHEKCARVLNVEHLPFLVDVHNLLVSLKSEMMSFAVQERFLFTARLARPLV